MRLESLLKDIQEVLSNVKNLEIVAASLYFVVNSLPLGIKYELYFLMLMTNFKLCCYTNIIIFRC